MKEKHKPKIILAEDSEAIANLFKGVLERNGYQVYRAKNPKEIQKEIEHTFQEQEKRILIAEEHLILNRNQNINPDLAEKLNTDRKYSYIEIILLYEGEKPKIYKRGMKYMQMPVQRTKLVEIIENLS